MPKLSDKKKDALIKEVVDRIKDDLSFGDSTAIEAMLSHCPTKNLILFLPEKNQKRYTKK